MVLLIGLLLLVLPSAAQAQVKAFPTAEGYGAQSVGGRGGQVLYVTKLTDDGSVGTLRWALTQTYPRTVMFKVSGTITLNDYIQILPSMSYLTIAGQSAPGGGIQTRNWPLYFNPGVHDVIIRHIRFRTGTLTITPPSPYDNGIDGYNIDGQTNGGAAGRISNVILDHISSEWATDENCDMAYNVTDLTLQWSICAEGYLGDSSTCPGCIPHSMGALWAWYGQPLGEQMRISAHHNLFAQNIGRNPRIGVNDPSKAREQLIDFRNNIVAWWGGAQATVELEHLMPNESDSVPLDYFGGSPSNPILEINLINNYFQGPSGSSAWPGTIGFVAGPSAIYLAGNGTWDFCPNSCDAGDQHWNVAFINAQSTASCPFCEYADKANYKVSSPFSTPAVTTVPISQVLSYVLTGTGAANPQGVGAWPRDSVDARIVTETQNQTGALGPFDGQHDTFLSDYPTLAQGTVPTDTDNDGIPDSWETAHGLNPNNASDGPAITASGYSNLEVYLNELAGDGSSPTEPQPSKDPLYLSAGGHGDVPSDSYTCTEAQTITTPFATWAKACTCLQGGQVLRIRGGTYQERIDMSVCPIPAGTAAAPTVIRAYDPGTGPEVVTFQLPVGSSGERVVDLVAPAHLQFKYLIFDGANRSNSAGVFILGGGNVLFEACEVKNVVHSLLYMENVTTISVKGTKISSTSSKNAVNLAGTINTVTLEGNEIASAALSGVNITTGTGESATSVTLVGNLIHNTGTGGAVAGVAVGSSTGTVLQNNVVYSNTKGIQILSGATGTTLQQNTVSKSTGVGVLCDSGASGAVVQNNLVCGNTTDTITNGCGLTLAGQGNITSCTPTAVYANYAANNFTLAASSPAINTGMALPALITDYLGAERPQQGSWDVGAYESVLGPEPIQTYATRQATGMLY